MNLPASTGAPRLLPARFRLASLLLGVILAGCASAPERASHPVTTVALSPVGGSAPAAPNAAAPLPPLPVLTSSEGAAGGTRRIRQLDVVEQDIRAVVRGLAESYGLDYELDPAVNGTVSTRLRDVTLQEALDVLTTSRGLQYQIQGNVLRVMPVRLQTRIFTLDYVSLARTGVATTTIQRRLGNTGAGTGIGAGVGIGAGAGSFAGAAGGGADVIQSVTVADLWEEIRVSLEGLIFANAQTGQALGGGEGAGPAGTVGARAPGPYSRVADDGQRLILNPLAGVIVVSAPDEKLQEVAAFLATVEGSVQRQVLIEAKIVEVSLNRRFQFGIDWSVVQRVGNVRLRFGVGQSGAELALESPGDPERAVSVVLTALEQQGDVSVLSSPRVSVLNNQRAVFNVTTDQVFFSVSRQPILGPTGATIGFNTEIQPQQVAVGITLDVLAQIAADRTITMNVRPIVTDVVAEKRVDLPDGTQASAPVIDRRETDTMVRARDGETIIIGGLMQTRRARESGGVPGLRDIPGLGRLFGGRTDSDDKRELVIFITPRIIAAQPRVGS